MFQFDPVMEFTFSQCAPFEESPIHESDDYKQLLNTFHTARQHLELRFPDDMDDIDTYLDTYLELAILEHRHYFSEGYRLGTGRAD